jgi:hypothetical protein
MDLREYVENLQRQITAAGGDDARPVVERLVAPLDAAIRLMLLEVLVAAAEEITCDLAPGSVEVRLRGRDPEFVVTPPAAGSPIDDLTAAGAGHPPIVRPPIGLAPPADADGDDGAISRINLRMPEQLKARVELAATGEGLSVNAWLVRAAAAALERTDAEALVGRRTPPGARRYTGWAR